MKELVPIKVVKGREGLSQALATITGQSKQVDHYFKFELGQQKSLIRLNLSAKPYYCWYADLQRRPPTDLIKDVILKFFIQHGMSAEEAAQHFFDIYRYYKSSLAHLGEQPLSSLPIDSEPIALRLLMNEVRPAATIWAKLFGHRSASKEVMAGAQKTNNLR